MKTTDQPESLGLGKKVEKPKPESKEPEWRPVDGHPGYLTNGKEVKHIPKPAGTVYDFFGVPVTWYT